MYFEAKLSFKIKDWYLSEKIAAKSFDINMLNDNKKLKLSLKVFPQQKTLLHMIAAKTEKNS